MQIPNIYTKLIEIYKKNWKINKIFFKRTPTLNLQNVEIVKI